MAELVISPYLLAIVFAVVAGVYGSVGLGGGSSYTALLAIFGASHTAIPPVSLGLNVLVTTVGAFHFSREGHARSSLVVPLLAGSLPAAYLGGSFELDGPTYQAGLLVVLLLIAVRIYLWEGPSTDLDLEGIPRWIACLSVGATIGLVSGLVGIGGGILLIPAVLLFGLGTGKQAAAAGVWFTGLNSASGLAAHLQRHVPELSRVAPLLVAVLVGGIVGSHLGATRLAPETVRRTLGIVILVACLLLVIRLFG